MDELSPLQRALLNAFKADSREKREFMHAPFQVDAYICATNGSAVIFVEGQCEDVLEKPSIKASILKILNSIPSDFYPLPALSIPEQKIEKCKECKGNGVVSWSTKFNEYEDTCKTCDGECQMEAVQPLAVDNSGLMFDAKYLRILSKIPGVRIAVGGQSLSFHSEHGKGVIWGLNKAS